MDYNFHTHTYRCHHATGTPDEYVKRAIEENIKTMGFSEHIPFIFPDGYESSYRMPYCEAMLYRAEIMELKEKYKNDINILLGFEMEYYPKYFDKMLQNAKKFGTQYLILGQHFIKQDDENHEGTYIFWENSSEDDLKEYVRCVICAMETGVFSYVAHPDIFNFIGDEEVYKREMQKICKASKEMSIPFEINFLGIRTNRIYPKEIFWELAGKECSPVTFGFDAHDAVSAFDGESLVVAEELVKKYSLNYIGKPKIKRLDY